MIPTLSIVLPTYRRPELLQRALASISHAVSAPHEIIVIDDDADGSGFAAARAHAAIYANKAGKQRGLSASRNLGLKLARGQYLVFLDDDDFFNPGGLDALLEVAHSAAGANSIVFGNYTTFTTEARSLHDLAPLQLEHLLICNQIPVGAYLIGRAALNGNFDEAMRSHEDWDFLLRHARIQPLRHVPCDVVSIDKTANQTDSMQARRRALFWLDFLSVYSRYPAPQLSQERTAMLASLGLQLAPEMLQFEDRI